MRKKLYRRRERTFEREVMRMPDGILRPEFYCAVAVVVAVALICIGGRQLLRMFLTRRKPDERRKEETDHEKDNTEN